MAPLLPASASPDGTPPATFGNEEAVRAWIETQKGFGVPQFAEFELSGRHVLVAWNCPFSGVSSVLSYSFQQQEPGDGWKLLDFTRFEKPNNLSYVYLDANVGELVYVGDEGRKIKAVAVPASWNGAPRVNR